MDLRRSQVLQKHITREMLGIEVGAFYNPTVAKADGWNVVVVDHDTKEGLLKAYAHDVHVTAESIQEVDVVWSGGLLSDALVRGGKPTGQFDYIVASHVIEHFPDLLGTLIDFQAVLKPGGVIVLAVPDLRYCFDFFMPWSTTADILDAHREGRTRHTKSAFYRMAAYSTTGIVNRGLPNEFVSASAVGLLSNVFHARDRYVAHDAGPAAPYVDVHTWYFTPASFELVMLELNALKLLDFEIVTSERGPAGEFLLTLRKAEHAFSVANETLSEQRLALLKQAAYELSHRAEMLDGQPRKDYQRELSSLAAENERLRNEVEALRKSSSWRITSPLRTVRSLLMR